MLLRIRFWTAYSFSDLQTHSRETDVHNWHMCLWWNSEFVISCFTLNESLVCMAIHILCYWLTCSMLLRELGMVVVCLWVVGCWACRCVASCLRLPVCLLYNVNRKHTFHLILSSITNACFSYVHPFRGYVFVNLNTSMQFKNGFATTWFFCWNNTKQ